MLICVTSQAGEPGCSFHRQAHTRNRAIGRIPYLWPNPNKKTFWLWWAEGLGNGRLTTIEEEGLSGVY